MYNGHIFITLHFLNYNVCGVIDLIVYQANRERDWGGKTKAMMSICTALFRTMLIKSIGSGQYSAPFIEKSNQAHISLSNNL